MTSRERLLTVLSGKIPDCVPVAPDFSNMIPAKLTGKPWWDIYLYNDPPIHEAYIAAAKYFNIDALMDGYFQFLFPWERESHRRCLEENPCFIIKENEEAIITQRRGPGGWWPTVDVFWKNQTPARNIKPQLIGLPAEPGKYTPVIGARAIDHTENGLKRTKELMGDQGLVGIFVIGSCVIGSEMDLFFYLDNPEEIEKLKRNRMEDVERKMTFLRDLPEEFRPDFLCFGGSGTLILQTLDFVREVTFPALKRGLELANDYGYYTHVHSCGPEAALVKLFAEESLLTVIDPLEIPPMGDCNLAQLKKLYGNRLVLKGNLHTTKIMLNGTPETVAAAARQAIDDAATGGRFILSTGDQCGRDTPEENLRTMINIARTYGRYDR